MRSLPVVVLLLFGCSSTPMPAPTTPKPVVVAESELSPALAPLAWLSGDWQSDEGTEHWVAASGAIYGVALQANGMFEVMIIDDGNGPKPADGEVRLFALPGGMKSVEYRASTMADRSATFANPEHGAPKTITYERTPEGLRATLDADANRKITFSFRPGTRQASPEIEAADRAFSADVGARGIEGWMAGFAPDGGISGGDKRLVGEENRAMMTGVLAGVKAHWEPVASARAGALGFTVGKATFTGATPADSWRSTYATIWKQQPDGTWKVLFNTGSYVNTP